MALDYPDGTYTIAAIPLVVLLLGLGWRVLKGTSPFSRPYRRTRSRTRSSSIPTTTRDSCRARPGRCRSAAPCPARKTRQQAAHGRGSGRGDRRCRPRASGGWRSALAASHLRVDGFQRWHRAGAGIGPPRGVGDRPAEASPRAERTLAQDVAEPVAAPLLGRAPGDRVGLVPDLAQLPWAELALALDIRAITRRGSHRRL